jgi:hypothetical protein
LKLEKENSGSDERIDDVVPFVFSLTLISAIINKSKTFCQRMQNI